MSLRRRVVSEESKLLWMFTQVHGELGRKFELQVDYDDDFKPEAITVLKHGVQCWTDTKTDLMFNYLTKDLK